MQNKTLNLSPLQLMQKFYHDYNRKQSHGNSDNPTCKYARKKSSNTSKMTQFLIEQDKKERGFSTNGTGTCNNNTMAKSSALSPLRQKASISQASKRCYFKSSYSLSHPFLTSSHKIGQKNMEQLKGLKTEPIEYCEGYKELKLMSPTENRKTIQDMKETIMRVKNLKKQKLDRVRYNYLVKNSFKNHQQQEVGFQAGSRMRYQQLNTKERIFPSAKNLKL